MSQKNASKSFPAASDIPFGHSWHNTKTPSVVRNGLSAVTMPSRSVAVLINPQWVTESYSAGKYEFLPCFLHVLEDAQIGLEVIPCGGLDVGVSELSCDHADVGSGLDRQRAERVA